MHKISIKTLEEIEIMAEGGKLLGRIRDETVKQIKPGMTTAEVDKVADELINICGGSASFKMVKGYHHATCVNLNDVVVHGVPNGTIIKDSDKVALDVGLYYKGWHTDTSTTISFNPEHTKFLEVGRRALKKAINEAKIGKRVTDVSWGMQSVCEAEGCQMVRALTGHGIGRELHEDPYIPCFVMEGEQYSPRLEEGMVIAIEVMYNAGTWDVVYKNDDGWTVGTADGKISGLFEETVAITKSGPRILTKSNK
jgi:methionyl aminopeptidase